MATFVLRLWLPDRPGALGAVASRIGAVRGDLVGIDILERGAGQVIDELVVELPSDDLVSLLVSEVGQVDGVEVEDVRRAAPVRSSTPGSTPSRPPRCWSSSPRSTACSRPWPTTPSTTSRPTGRWWSTSTPRCR